MAGEPLGDMTMYFKKMQEQRMPQKQYEAHKLTNIKGFGDEAGCKLLNVESEAKDWDVLAKVWYQLNSGTDTDIPALQKISRRAVIHPNLRRDPPMEDIVEFQRDMGKHLTYSFTVSYTKHLGIATLEKMVE